MLVKATREGYAGDRIRSPGQTFNYTPETDEDGKPIMPSWMVPADVKSVDPTQAMHDNISKLSAIVDEAKKALAIVEAEATTADEALESAKNKAEKAAAVARCETANEEVDKAASKLAEAEQALADAESSNA